jgi:predicted nucleic acid-binding protein
MILYLDTSSLVKLYVVEPGSPDVQRGVERAELVSTSVVTSMQRRAPPSLGDAARRA